MILHNYLARQQVRIQATRRAQRRERRIRAITRHMGMGIAMLGIAALYGACIVGFVLP